MIYGIKEIEKQFPGFEANWTGGVLFDLRDVFNKMTIINRNEDPIIDFSRYVNDNYWDIIIPPSDKMYILAGKKFLTDGPGYISTEYAIEMERGGDYITVRNVYIADYNHQTQETSVCRFKNILFGPKLKGTFSEITSSTGYYWAQPAKDIKNLLVQIYGKTGERIVKQGKEYKFADFIKTVAMENLGCLAADIPTALFYLNVRNIKQKESRISQQRGFYYPKAWGREYKVLSLSQTLTERSPGLDLPPGYHVRGHFQRGHFKRKKTGVYWWNPHWRGDFSKGIVMKDYKMKAPKIEEGQNGQDGKDVMPIPQGENAVVVH